MSQLANFKSTNLRRTRHNFIFYLELTILENLRESVMSHNVSSTIQDRDLKIVIFCT